MYEYFDMYVFVIVRYVVISPLGALYLQINAVARKEPSFDFAPIRPFQDIQRPSRSSLSHN